MDVSGDVEPQRDVSQSGGSGAGAASAVRHDDGEGRKKGTREQPAAAAAGTGFLSPFAAMAEQAGSLFGPAM